MSRGLFSWFAATLFAALLVPGGETAAVAQEGLHEPAADPLGNRHRHDPVDIDSRPIVSRFHVSLIRPRRLLHTPEGDVFIADWGAGTVVQIEPGGEASVLIDGLDEPAGLARDPMGNLYVSTHADGMTGAGTVIRITPSGEQTVYASGLTGPTGLAFDAEGNLFVAEFDANAVVRINPDGEPSPVAANIPAPAGVAFDPAGRLYAVSSTEGTLLRISPMGDVAVVCSGLLVPSDVVLDPAGHLIVANYGGTELAYVDTMGNARTFALVPKGTIGIGFDTVGNLLLVNWDYHYAMKVVTYLSVPCPHCGEEIPVRLRLNKQPPSVPETPTGPVI